MRPLSALELIEAWDAPANLAAHFRLERLLLAALDGEDISSDTLGRRNQRLIMLRRALGATRPIEAVARCDCGVENEVTVPADAIEAAPTPPPGTRISVEVDGRVVVARTPTIADLAAIAPIKDPQAAGAALLARCMEGTDDDAALDLRATLAALAATFEAIDPAADIRLSVNCVGCGAPLSVVVDLAMFVGRDIARQIADLVGEIDSLARTYGWSEADILALPLVRRRRYVAMVRGDMFGGAT